MKRTSVDGILKKFSSLRVLIVGDVMIDAYYWGKVERISPEAPVPIVSVEKTEDRLGGAANVALNVAQLGATPIICSVVGNDANGKRLKSLLQGAGLAQDGIVASTQRPTTVKTRVISGDQQMIRVDEEVTTELSAKEQNNLWKKIKTQLTTKKIDVVIFQDYNKGVLTVEMIQRTLKLCEQLNIPTVADPKKNNFLNYLGVSLFKPNLKEIQEGLKMELNTVGLSTLKKAARLLRREMNHKATLITLSEKGVFIEDGTSSTIVPAHIRNIADVSGAGDTVVSVAALALALNRPPEEVAALSNLAGGLVCEQVGVVPIDKKRLASEAKKLKHFA